MIYRLLLRPILFLLPPELAHNLALRSINSLFSLHAFRQSAARRQSTFAFGRIKRFGLHFTNPVGLAAGFDKNGTSAQKLAALGFGFIEVGTVTAAPQAGNLKPRVFRLPRDRALINRLGFNNRGAEEVAQTLKERRPECVLGVNIGKSRNVSFEEAPADYLKSFAEIYSVADYIAINVSSPNTPNLRNLQQPQMLSLLLKSLQQGNRELAQRQNLPAPKPLLLKIAPDLSEGEVESIVDIALRNDIAGIIATNTTVSRKDLQTTASVVDACGEGGLSGAPLKDRSNAVIAAVYRYSHGALPIIGVGGVFSGADAWEKICAGASLIQLYTGLIYEGPGIVRRINQNLAALLKREGFASLDDAVGCRAREEFNRMSNRDSAATANSPAVSAG